MTDVPVVVKDENRSVPRTYRGFLIAAFIVGLIVMAMTGGSLLASVFAFVGVMALPAGFAVTLNLLD